MNCQNEDGEWTQFIRQVFQMAEPYLEIRGDIHHTQVAHRYVRVLIKHEGGDKKIIEPAIILHDVGWSKLELSQIAEAYGVRADGEEADRLNRIHELEGASIAQQILYSLHYDRQLIGTIVSIIKTHDSGNDAHSLEEKLVKDADKLWRYSEIGFWEEIERQGLDAPELYQHLSKHHQEWFFTQTALNLAEEELQKREEEVKRIT